MRYRIKVMVYGDKDKPKGNGYRKKSGELFYAGGICVVYTHCLEGRGKTVQQMQCQQDKRNNVDDSTPYRFKFLHCLRVIAGGIFRIGGNVFKGHFMGPKIVHVQADKGQNHRSRDDHVPGDPRRIGPAPVLGVFDLSCTVVPYFQHKTHYKMDNYPSDQDGLEDKLHKGVVTHKMGPLVKGVRGDYGRNVDGKMLC